MDCFLRGQRHKSKIGRAEGRDSPRARGITEAMNEDNVITYRPCYWESYLSELCTSEQNMVEEAEAR